MSFRSVRYARAAMAAPAVLLFLVMCLSLIFNDSSVDGSSSSEDGDGDGGNNGHHLVRGSSAADKGAGGGGDTIIDDSADENISVRHHHGHHNSGRNNDHGRSEPQDKAAKDDSFDYYVYSMSFQPEFCRENNEKFVGCKNFEEVWEGQLTIHGLWPSRDDGTWPSTCTDEKLDTSLLQDFSEELEQNWPNVKALVNSPSHEAFWEHEWSKHGTCSGLTQPDYFQTALDLLLPTPGIVKENYGSVVKRKDLEEGYTGSDMSVFVCKYGYLSEVRLCYEKTVDSSVGERVTCPEANLKEDSCGDEIKIASFDTRGLLAIE